MKQKSKQNNKKLKISLSLTLKLGFQIKKYVRCKNFKPY